MSSKSEHFSTLSVRIADRQKQRLQALADNPLAELDSATVSCATRAALKLGLSAAEADIALKEHAAKRER